MSFVFFVLFQNTFKINVFVPNLVKNVSSKKIMIFIFFDFLCSFLFFFVVFAGFGLQNVLKQRTKKNKKDHAAGKIARCPLFFFVGPPPL